MAGISPHRIYSQTPPPRGSPTTDSAPSSPHPLSSTAASSPIVHKVPTNILNIYGATYSGIHVYEMLCKNVAVMRRKSDSWLNATQILKVAQIEKGKRTKILEKEIMTGQHEKVQGGYGKYQGTWVPFGRGVEIARQYNVENLLQPLIDFEPPPEGHEDMTPTKEQVNAAQKEMMRKSGVGMKKEEPRIKRKKYDSVLELTPNAEGRSVSPDVEVLSRDGSPGRKRQRLDDGFANPTRHRAAIMQMFVETDPDYKPDLLTRPPPDLDVNIVIDDLGHTCVHWAAALARMSILRLLVERGADVRRPNNLGESALMRSVLVTNNYDSQTFMDLLDYLHPSITHIDSKGRTVLHHIATTAGMKGRSQASRYYMECTLEWIARRMDGAFSSLVNIRDKEGNTALNIAARIGNRNLMIQLLDVGADPLLPNFCHLKPADFGFDDLIADKSGRGGVEREGKDGRAQIADGVSGTKIVYPGISPSADDAMREGRLTHADGSFAALSTSWDEGMRSKFDQLQLTQQNLVEITRQLADVRRQNETLRKQNRMIPEMEERIKNLEKCLGDQVVMDVLKEVGGGEKDEGKWDGTGDVKMSEGGGEAPKSDTSPNGEPTDFVGGLVVLQAKAEPSAMNDTQAPPPPPPTTPPTTTAASLTAADLQQQVIRLKTELATKERAEQRLVKELVQLRSKSTEQEMRCKRIIAACCEVEVGEVDELLGPLMKAVEADREVGVDVRDVAGFLGRIRCVGERND
ncbi:transcriptional regulator swi6 [Rhizophlyctis rosea]|nr:transcriptional regulator swi6 [Rhizophlyctis rosea]